MRPDLRRRGGLPALGLLTACGVVLAGCSSQTASPSHFGSADGAAQGAATVVTVACPKVADALPDVQVSRSVRRAVARNLGILEIQVADANRRLAQTSGAQDAAAAQQAVLSTLANQRAVTIERIAAALDGVTQRPENFGDLANCTLNTGGAAAPTVAPTVDPSAGQTVNPTPNPSAAPTDAATVAPSVDPTVAPTGGADPTAGAVEVQAANASAEPLAKATQTATANPTAAADAAATANANATGTAAPNATANATADPNATATAAPTNAPAQVNQRLIVCPSVAEQIVIPSSVKSQVALELGLLELEESAANEKLTGGTAANAGTGQNTGQNNAQNNGQNTGQGNGLNNGQNTGQGNGLNTGQNAGQNVQNVDQDAVLRNLERRRAAGLSRIAQLLRRSGGQAVQDLGALASCQIGGDALVDNNGGTGAAVPTVSPTDAAASPAPTGSAAPAATPNTGNGGGNDVGSTGVGDGANGGSGAGDTGGGSTGGSGDGVLFEDSTYGY